MANNVKASTDWLVRRHRPSASQVAALRIGRQLGFHPNGRRVCVDALPERITYQDRGCSLAPSCLSCPFEHCRHDAEVGRAAKAWSYAQRDEEMRCLHSAGIEVGELVEMSGVSKRSVWRVLAGRSAS
jgi:hypothetical protein